MKILKENRVIDRDTVLFFCGVFAFLYSCGGFNTPTLAL